MRNGIGIVSLTKAIYIQCSSTCQNTIFGPSQLQMTEMRYFAGIQSQDLSVLRALSRARETDDAKAFGQNYETWGAKLFSRKFTQWAISRHFP